jgi:hypothetical protein
MKANQTVCTGLDSLIESSQIPGLQVAVVTAERTVFEQLRAHSLVLSDSVRMQFYTRQQTNAGAAVPTTLGWHVGMLNGAPVLLKEAIMLIAPTTQPPVVGPIQARAPPSRISPTRNRITRSTVGTFLT